MSFSYDFSTNPAVANVRLLIGNTNVLKPVFSDEEINAFYAIQASTFQSGMLYSGTAGRTLPSGPLSVLRVAALALDSLASNRARIAAVSRMLDVTIMPGVAAKALHDQAQCWREVEDNSGALAIIEQCTTTFGFIDRWWKQMQRQSGGGI